MSFSRMKPVPKFLILGSLVAVLGYGVHLWMQSGPKTPVAEALKVETTTVPAEGTPQAVQQAEAAKAQLAPPAAIAPAPAAPTTPAPGLTPAGGQDAGLDAVLKAGKK
jgi:hypothetical protein